MVVTVVVDLVSRVERGESESCRNVSVPLWTRYAVIGVLRDLIRSGLNSQSEGNVRSRWRGVSEVKFKGTRGNPW